MPGAMSNYLENKLINNVLRNTAYTPPATVYIALFTSDPTEAGTGVEVVGNAYARQVIAFGAPTDGTVTNSADVLFPVATGNWGTITHYAIFDAVTVGNMLIYGALSASKTITVDTQLKFPATYLSVSFD